MHRRQYAPKPAQDTSILSSEKLLQTRPFQPEINNNPKVPSMQASVQPMSGGWDLTKMEFVDGPPRSPILGPLLQAKLTIGAPNDKYEQEADRLAQQVVQRLSVSDRGQSANGKAPPSQPNQTLQRETLTDEEDELQMKPLAEQIQRMELPEEDELQMKPLLQRELEPDEEDELQMKPDSLQREVEPDEEDELQMKPLLQRQGSGAVAASDALESAIQQSRGSGQPLADSIREPMEQAFGGVDFRGVNVHTDGRSDQLNRSIQAKAFTTGQDIFFRQGAYQPGSQRGQELLAHELTHVVQQNGGVVQRSRPSTPSQISQQEIALQAKLEHTQRSGHSLSKIKFGSRPTPPMIQPKLTIGVPGDKYEQEADRVAQQVVQRLRLPQSIAPKHERCLPQPQAVQRETLLDDVEMVEAHLARSEQKLADARSDAQPIGQMLQMYSIENGPAQVINYTDKNKKKHEEVVGTSGKLKIEAGEEPEGSTTSKTYGVYKEFNLIQGHIINDNLGGLAITGNLFPITQGMNKHHSHFVEQTVKSMFLGAPKGMDLEYEVTVKPNGANLSAYNATEAKKVTFEAKLTMQSGVSRMPPFVWEIGEEGLKTGKGSAISTMNEGFPGKKTGPGSTLDTIMQNDTGAFTETNHPNRWRRHQTWKVKTSKKGLLGKKKIFRIDSTVGSPQFNVKTRKALIAKIARDYQTQGGTARTVPLYNSLLKKSGMTPERAIGLILRLESRKSKLYQGSGVKKPRREVSRYKYDMENRRVTVNYGDGDSDDSAEEFADELEKTGVAKVERGKVRKSKKKHKRATSIHFDL